MSVVICDAERPGMDGDVYRLPYIEAVDGKRRGHRDQRGRVQWTRHRPLVADPRCPECRRLRR